MDSILKPGHNIQNEVTKPKEWKPDPKPQNLLTLKEDKKTKFAIKTTHLPTSLTGLNYKQTYRVALICDLETYGEDMEEGK